MTAWEAERERVVAEQIPGATAWLRKRRGATREAADDAVQEALLQLVELSTRTWPDNVAGWLRRVAERRLIDADRRRSKVSTADDLDATQEGPDLDALLAIRAALRGLERETRAIVVRRLAGASWAEISAREGLSEEAARKRFARALAILADQLPPPTQGQVRAGR
jgi:RNA polymerase sigma factor (sigma-70 family)